MQLALLAAGAVLAVMAGLAAALRPDTVRLDRRLRSLAGSSVWLTDDQHHLAASVQMTQFLANRVNRSVSGWSFAAALQLALLRADVKLTVGEFLILQGVAATIIGSLAFLISGAPLVALVFAGLGSLVPRYWLRRRHAARLKAFNDQLADALSLMSNSLRSGSSLVQSMETMAREAAPPTSDEFNRVVREIGLGVRPQEALQHVNQRLASRDLDLVVTAILVQFDVGGNLSKVLDSIAATIRERVKLQGEIKTLAAQGQMAGYMLSGLPVVISGVLMLIAPSYIGKLFTPGPWLALPFVAGIGLVMGTVVMRKLTNIDI